MLARYRLRLLEREWARSRGFGLGDLEGPDLRAGRGGTALGALRVALGERPRLHPGGEVGLAAPAGVDEVAVLALDGAQELEVLEPVHLVDLAGTVGEPLLQDLAHLGGHGQ